MVDIDAARLGEVVEGLEYEGYSITGETCDITDPAVFRFPSHFARMSKGMIAVVQPVNSNFCVLVKLLDLFENDILFQWEVRSIT